MGEGAGMGGAEVRSRGSRSGTLKPSCAWGGAFITLTALSEVTSEGLTHHPLANSESVYTRVWLNRD